MDKEMQKGRTRLVLVDVVEPSKSRCPVTPASPNHFHRLSLSRDSRATSPIYQTPGQPRNTPRDPTETMAQVPPGARLNIKE